MLDLPILLNGHILEAFFNDNTNLKRIQKHIAKNYFEAAAVIFKHVLVIYMTSSHHIIFQPRIVL